MALENMSVMISEILYESAKAPISTEELMNTVLAQVSIRIPAKMIRYSNSVPEAVMRVNKIRLARAVINLVNNAFEEVDKENGVIEILVEMPDPGIVRISVRDNGRGIAPEAIGRVFDIGYSGKQSTGLGLAFTKQVVEGHGGTIRITSREGEYTEARIRLPAEEREQHGGTGKEDTFD